MHLSETAAKCAANVLHTACYLFGICVVLAKQRERLWSWMMCVGWSSIEVGLALQFCMW